MWLFLLYYLPLLVLVRKKRKGKREKGKGKRKKEKGKREKGKGKEKGKEKKEATRNPILKRLLFFLSLFCRGFSPRLGLPFPSLRQTPFYCMAVTTSSVAGANADRRSTADTLLWPRTRTLGTKIAFWELTTQRGQWPGRVSDPAEAPQYCGCNLGTSPG